MRAAVHGDERGIRLVVINGTPRYRTSASAAADGPLEKLRVGGEQRVLWLQQGRSRPARAAVVRLHVLRKRHTVIEGRVRAA